MPMQLHVGDARPVATVAGGLRYRRIVPKRRVVKKGICDVEPKTIDMAPEPPIQYFKRRLACCGRLPVQFRLLTQEFVMIASATRRMVRPGRPAERRQPIVWRGAVVARRCPDVPVRLLSGFETFNKPRMLIRRMREHLVGHDLQPARMRFPKQVVEVCVATVFRIDDVVIRNVVTPVAIGRRVDWRQPDGIDAQRGNVVELRDQSFEVTDAVAIRIGEAADIDLIDGSAAPPGRAFAHTSFSLLMMRETRPYAIASSADIQKFRSVSVTTFS